MIRRALDVVLYDDAAFHVPATYTSAPSASRPADALARPAELALGGSPGVVVEAMPGHTT